MVVRVSDSGKWILETFLFSEIVVDDGCSNEPMNSSLVGGLLNTWTEQGW